MIFGQVKQKYKNKINITVMTLFSRSYSSTVLVLERKQGLLTAE